MSIESLLYLINVIGNLVNISSLLRAVSFISSIVCFVVHVVNEASNRTAESGWRKDEYIHCRYSTLRVFKIVLPILLVSSIVCTISPDQKTMYAMAFASYSKQSNIPEKFLKAIEFKLDEVIKGSCDK